VEAGLAAVSLREVSGEEQTPAVRRDGPPDFEVLAPLLRAAERADGRRPLGERRWLELVSPGQGQTHVIGLCVGPRGGAIDGYGHLSGDDGKWDLEIVVHPDRRSGIGVEAVLLDAAVDAISAAGGGHLTLWRTAAGPRSDAVAGRAGFALEREVLQLRVDLPVPDAVRAAASAAAAGAGLRAFRPDHDEQAWLDVNNRAFADHPEQGGWTIDDLLTRERREWFDPAGFLVLEIDGHLAGSCWTKMHRDGPTPLGEIYVISVDPDLRHRGLGRALAVAGLDHLSGAGITVGMLYTDATNEPALALYRSLGFTVHHVDRAYGRSVAPAAGQPQAPDTPTRRPTP
jgi:mycothiol synthase